MNIVFLAKNLSHFRFYKIVCDVLAEEGHNGKILSLNGYDDGGKYSLPDVVKIKRGVKYEGLAKNSDAVPMSLAKYIVADRELRHFNRIFFGKTNNTESVWGLAESVVSQVEKIIENESPHFFISEFVTGLYDGVLHEQCLEKSIGFISVRQSKMSLGVVFCKNNKDFPSSRFDEKLHLDSSHDPNSSMRSSDEIKKIRTAYATPSYMVKTKKNLIPSFDKFIMLLERLYFSIKFGSVSELNDSVFWYVRKFFNYLRSRKFSKIKDLSSYGRDFFVFPLHYEPEQSVDIRGYPYSQLELVEMIAKLLPSNTHLLVKEHRGNLGYRMPYDYQRIVSLPNVSLVSPHIDSKELVQKSLGVLTIAGRMGWEASVLSRPVFVFGDCFYRELKNIGKFTCLNALGHFLRDPASYIACSSSVRDAARRYENAVYPGNFVLNSDEFISKANAKKFVQSLMIYLNEK